MTLGSDRTSQLQESFWTNRKPGQNKICWSIPIYQLPTFTNHHRITTGILWNPTTNVEVDLISLRSVECEVYATVTQGLLPGAGTFSFRNATSHVSWSHHDCFNVVGGWKMKCHGLVSLGLQLCGGYLISVHIIGWMSECREAVCDCPSL